VKLTTHLLLLPKLRTSGALPPLLTDLQFNEDNFNIIWAVKIKVAGKNVSRHKDIQEHKRPV
jgi:hypothetical protein